MPDETAPAAPAAAPGGLSADQLKRLAELFEKKFGQRPCEMCGNESWSFNTSLASPIIISMGADSSFNFDLGHGCPSVAIHCTNCGNTKLFALLHLGFDLHG